MIIRFYQYSEEDFSLEVKKWYGWEHIYMYGGVFSIKMYFKTKEEGLNYLRRNIKKNPFQISFIEHPTIVVHKTPDDAI